jgi:hypothetical protein
VYFEYNAYQDSCTGYGSARPDGGLADPCKSGVCPYGVQNWDQGTDTNGGASTFYAGPCMAQVPGG